jgi:multiple sugar transport system ATP-binding protein
MSTRIAVISDGEIQQTGTPEEIYSRPTNRFVASFVGSPSMSFIEAQIEEGLLKFGNFTADVSSRNLEKSGPVVAGIRPEDVALAPVGQARAGAEAAVLLIEPFGSFAVATLEHSDLRLKAVVSPGKPFCVEPGTQVSFNIDGSRIHVFDPVSGKALQNLAHL